MKVTHFWSMTFICIVMMLLTPVAWAQQVVQVPFQSTPGFIGYVEDEFVLEFTPAERGNVVARQNAKGKPEVNLASVQALIEQHGVEKFHRQFRGAKPQPLNSRRPDLTGYYKVKLGPASNLDEAIRAFKANPHVEDVEKIGIHTLNAEPNDPYYQDSPNSSFPYDQWHYWDASGIGADLAWDIETGDTEVLVGVLDSGVRYFHKDLGGDSAPWGPRAPFYGGNIFINADEASGRNNKDDDNNGYVDDTVGWDFVTFAGGAGIICIDQDCSRADNDPDDFNGHGTHVGGTIGAITNNNTLVAGIAGGYKDGTTAGVGNGIKIIPLRIGYHASYLGQTTGIVRMDWAAEAMHYVAGLVDAGYNVAAVNCSWGSSDSGGLNDAVDALLNRGVMVVHAAGNSGSESADFLGSKSGVLNVAATDRGGVGAIFSNYGSWVDVAAPGVDVLSTYRNPTDTDESNHYIALMSGTSMAAPHVSGIAALLESHNPDLSGSDKFELIVNNTTPYSDNRNLGSGIANANLALLAAGGAGGCDIEAEFIGNPISGCAPLAVDFTDMSSGTGINGWSWDLGDGSSASTTQNPSHTYNTAGTYSVSLTTSSSSCSDTMNKSGYITVNSEPVADFSASPISGVAPLTVDFSDLSTGEPTSWSWDFGTDSATSALQNPSYTYSEPGTYTVSLSVSNNCGSPSLAEKLDYITVSQPVVSGDMHVSDIVVTGTARGRNTHGVAIVTINNSTGDPVEGATATGIFSYNDKDMDSNVSGVTNLSGQATLDSGNTKASTNAEWCFEVTSITKSGFTYDAALNLVTKSCESGDQY